MTTTRNVNLGLLGHVDSGKTSIAKALSRFKSTAAFDKSRQSQERGITLDLGFSSFMASIKNKNNDDELVRITLVDCPGHASLLKTVVGSLQILDGVILVIDANKGIQHQTVECLALVQILLGIKGPGNLFVALSKADQFLGVDCKGYFATSQVQNYCESKPDSNVDPNPKFRKIDDLIRNLRRKVFRKQRFPFFVPIVATSTANKDDCYGVQLLLHSISENLLLPDRGEPSLRNDQFVAAYDHSFQIKGSGLVFTGTVLEGCVSKSQSVFIAETAASTKVKNVQVFGDNVNKAIKGDRIGLRLGGSFSEKLERGFICSDLKSCPKITSAIVRVRPLEFFKDDCLSKKPLTVVIGYRIVTATPIFFCSLVSSISSQKVDTSDGIVPSFDVSTPHLFLEKLPREKAKKSKTYSENLENLENKENLKNSKNSKNSHLQIYALLSFSRPVVCPRDSFFVAFKPNSSSNFRLPFYGNFLETLSDPSSQSAGLCLCREKAKRGVVDRVLSVDRGFVLIGKNMFGKNAVLEQFTGMRVVFGNRREGLIEEPFGNFAKNGKFKIRPLFALNELEESKSFCGAEFELRFYKAVRGSAKKRIFQ